MNGVVYQDLDTKAHLYSKGQLKQLPYHVLAICLQGQIDVSINHQDYELKAHHVVVVLAGSHVMVDFISPDCIGYALKIDRGVLQRLSMIKNSAQYKYIEQNPVVPLNPDSLDVVLAYRSLFKKLSSRVCESFIQTQTLYDLFSSFELEISQSYLCSAKDKLPLNDDYLLFNEFIFEVRKKHATERNVEYYAELFAMSRPQFTKLIRESSGKTPKEWINDAVLKTAKDLLVSFNLTVSEISFRLNFTHQSAFGSFFKKETGLTPQRYRDNWREIRPNRQYSDLLA